MFPSSLPDKDCRKVILRLNASDYLRALAVCIAYYIVFQVFYNLIAEKTAFPYDSIASFWKGVVYNFFPVLLTFGANIFIVFFTNYKFCSRLKILLDTVLSFVAMIGINCLFKIIVATSTDSSYCAIPVDWAGTTFNNIFILLGVEVFYYVRHLRLTEVEVEKQQRMMLDYKYKALRAQFDPHFLFNSLNTLYSLAEVSADKSKEFIVALSSIYRYILLQYEREIVPVKDELEFSDAYIYTLKMRYPNLNIIFNGRGNEGSQCIIPFTLQILIENIIKHNVISSAHPMTVHVNISETEMRITNRVCPKKNVESFGIGLHYLCVLYERHRLKIETEYSDEKWSVNVPFINPRHP